MEEIEKSGNLLNYRNTYSIDFINTTLERENLSGLRIFYFWDDQKISDFSFLKKIKRLNSLSLFVKDEVDFSFLYELKELKELTIQTLFSPIDFSKLPQLKSLALQWNKTNILNISALEGLKHLSFSDYTENDLEIIPILPSLKSLAIATAKCTTLNGIEKLANLEVLSIGAFRQLTDISAISSLHRLRYIEFDICPKMRNFSPLGSLQNMEVLELLDCKNLESIQFVMNMKKLQQLSLLGTTVVNDYDLMPAKDIERVYGGVGKKYNIQLKEKEVDGKRRSFSSYVSKL